MKETVNKNQPPLILIGGGGHCKSVIEAAESSGRIIKGILDIPAAVGTKILGYDVIGTDDDIPMFIQECEFVVTLGNIKDPRKRIQLHDLVEKHRGKLATIIASTAQISKHASIGDGTVILHHATVNAGSKIGKGCIINTASNVEHDVEIGEYTHVSTGAMINGDARIGRATFIGSGSAVANGVTIKEHSVIGMGTAVCSDITESGTYVGVPAKRIR